MQELPKVPRERLDLRPANWNAIPHQSRVRFLHPGEMEVIVALLRSVKAEEVVEFGCQNGRTARVLLDTLPEIFRYVGIDVTPEHVTSNVVQRKEVPAIAGEFALGDPRFDLIVKPRGSHDVEADEIGMVDAAFIDGDHSRAGVENDYRLALQVVRNGGIVIAHDYHHLRDKEGKPLVDVEDVLHELAAKGRKIEHVDGTWIAFERV